MIVFIFLVIIVGYFIKEVCTQTKQKLYQMKWEEITAAKQNYSKWELHLVQLALPFRCLEFFFSNDKDLENHVLNVYSSVQIERVKEILEKEYSIINTLDMKSYQSSTIWTLLQHYQFKQIAHLTHLQHELSRVEDDLIYQLISSVIEETKAEVIESGLPLPSQDPLTTIYNTISYIKHHVKSLKEKSRLNLLDKKGVQYIEGIYCAHLYLLAYEVGYISKVELEAMYWDKLVDLRTISNEQEWNYFLKWNKVIKTGSVIQYFLVRKVRRTAFGKYGVLTNLLLVNKEAQK